MILFLLQVHTYILMGFLPLSLSGFLPIFFFFPFQAPLHILTCFLLGFFLLPFLILSAFSALPSTFSSSPVKFCPKHRFLTHLLFPHPQLPALHSANSACLFPSLSFSFPNQLHLMVTLSFWLLPLPLLLLSFPFLP